MRYRKLGKWGLQVSELGLGSWITFGSSLDIEQVKKLMKEAFDAGINLFDNAEVYGEGVAETLMGQALQLFPRDQIVVTTKLFWGGHSPNQIGLSHKHLMEGTKNSLKRLGLEYVDILYCHRPDPNTPVEETVRAMDLIIRSGFAFYWGTSEWPKELIEEAQEVAARLHAFGPVVEQPQYNLFHRGRVEKEYVPLYKKYGMGITSWSPLDSGILTGKYNDGIPAKSRLSDHEWLKDQLSQAKIQKVKKLQEIAQGLGCTVGQLALSWCLLNPHVSSVLLGVTSSQQLKENLQTVRIKENLTEDIVKEINSIFI